MKRSPRAVGTAAESAVARYLQDNGFPNAERRSLKGAQDQGDITGIPGVCIEVKGGTAARDAITATRSTRKISAWLAETEVERVNSGADLGVLVVQTPGTTDPGRWWAVLPLHGLLCLSGVREIPAQAPGEAEVRLFLSDVVAMLNLSLRTPQEVAS